MNSRLEKTGWSSNQFLNKSSFSVIGPRIQSYLNALSHKYRLKLSSKNNWNLIRFIFFCFPPLFCAQRRQLAFDLDRLGVIQAKARPQPPLNAFELYCTPLMPLWPLTPITGNKVYSSPNQDMHQRDCSLIPSHTETAVSRVEGGCLNVWEGMRVKTGLEPKSQSMVTPQKKRNQGIVFFNVVV